MNAVSWIDAMAAPDKWRGTLKARAPQITVWALSLALGVQAATTVTHLAGAGRPAPAVAAQPATGVAPGRQHLDVAQIANAHLFGQAATAPITTDAANAPKTSMPLVLSGIIAATNPRDGLAIIGESAAAAHVYAVGDNVPGGARVNSVYADRVLLDRGGRIEALVLPHQYGSGMPPPPTAAAPDNGFDRLRRTLEEQPGLMADVMRPQPVFADGKQRGYRVYPGRNRQAFMRLGLRPGDLVVGINGTPLDDPARGDEIFRTIGSASEAHVTVVRNGRQQDLALNLAQLASDAQQLAGPEASGQPQAPPPGAPPMPPGPPQGVPADPASPNSE